MTRPPLSHGRACGQLFACAVGAYLAWPRAVVPPLKGKIPEIIRKTSQAQNQTPVDFLQDIQTKSLAYCRSDQLAGREEFSACMKRIFQVPGLSMVVGGASLGKTKIIKQLVSSLDDASPVIYLNMYGPLVSSPDDVMKRLELKLLDRAPKFLKKLVARPWRRLFAALRFGIAAAPEAKIKKFIKRAEKKGKVPAFVIDQAHLALPSSGSSMSSFILEEALSFMSFALSVTKEESRTALILISSEYGYPYRFEALGLNILDAARVIVAPEVARETMIQVLRDQWGMTQELAEAFEEHFGGQLFLCKQAVTKLIYLFVSGRAGTFDPYRMLANVDLPALVESSATRGHVENIADKGWSPVDETNEEGAKEIAKNSYYGVVIDRETITFDVPEEVKEEVLKGGVKQVLIPPSRHMRACISRMWSSSVQRRRLGTS